MGKNNTITRILVSLAAVPVILFLCISGGFLFLALVMGISLLAQYEYFVMSKSKGLTPQLIAPMAANAAVILNAYFNFIDFGSLIAACVITVILVEMFRNRGSAMMNTGTAVFGLLYIGLCLSMLVGIREMFPKYYYASGGYLIVSILATIWLCDSAAFFVGINFGRHRLFERVSPKKSWEGAVGGFVFALIAMVAARYLLLTDFSVADSLIIGAIVGIVGQMGDLAESLLKRDAGVKDSSNLIPGHGGIFDRFDSLIAVAPLVFIYVKYFILQ